MTASFFEFLKQHPSLLVTTHQNPDPDGIGAEIVLSRIAATLGNQIRIVNTDPTPKKFQFMDPENIIETWDHAHDKTPDGAGMLILDTADEYNIGKLSAFIPKAAGVFLIDHHEPIVNCTFDGIIDPKASSTCEITVELAEEAGVRLTPESAMAAFAGLAYDSGFFAYSKTTIRTFRAAMTLTEAGVNPYDIYRHFYEKSSIETLLLEKAVFGTLQIREHGRVAVQFLRRKDLLETGANSGDGEHLVSAPLKCKDIEVSILVKENKEGLVRCSLRSKGKVNVSKIAQELGGGGHLMAAGFRSSLSPEMTIDKLLKRISKEIG